MHECRAAGKLRKKKMRPLVGDWVLFEPPGDVHGGRICEIEARSTELVRPPVANVDTQIIVASPGSPAPDLMLIDRLLLQARKAGIEPFLVVNKKDIDPGAAEALRAQYEAASRTFLVSAERGDGVDQLREALRGRTLCFSGQSAVGKSTLLNALCGLQQETGGLSERAQRGRHTTRTCELFPCTAIDAYVADTPGFSVLDTVRIEPSELSAYYPEIAAWATGCRFASCVHRNEPGCTVRAALEAGRIHPGRYRRYLEILREQEDRNIW